MSAPHSTWFAAVYGLLTRRQRSIRHRALCSRPKRPFPPRVIDRTYPVLASCRVLRQDIHPQFVVFWPIVASLD
jgi:hypothetical protein